MSDPKVEQMRTKLLLRDVDLLRYGFDNIDYLLTKLDEAENALRSMPGYTSPPAFRGAVSELLREKQDAEERERALIAGVRKALEYLNQNDGHNAVHGVAHGILSSLLTNTPTEEGKK